MPESSPAPLFPARPWLIPVADADGNQLDAARDREKWTAARFEGLGGSDVAAIVGESTDKSAIDVWEERIGTAMPFMDNDFTFMGRELEPVVLNLYARGGEAWPRAGGDLALFKPPTMYHRDRPWQRGSPDGLVWDASVARVVLGSSDGVGVIEANHPSTLRSLLAVEPDHGVEVKTHGWFAARAQYDRDDDGVPVSVPAAKRIQCAWYMALFKIPRWTLIALVDTHKRKTYEIPHDQAVEDYLLEEADLFWRRHIIGREPPPPDGSKSFKAYLSRRFADHDAEIVESTAEIDDAAAELHHVRAAEKELKERRDLLEQQIQSHIGGHAGVKTALGVITYKSRASGKYRDKEMRLELYTRLGMTDAEIGGFETRFKQPGFRAMNLPSAWRSK